MKLMKAGAFALLTVLTNVMIQTGPSEPVAQAAVPSEGAIVGTWESDQKDVRMEYFKQGDRYVARLLWGNLIVESDGVTSKKDAKNPDEKLRSRNIIGVVSLTGLTWDGEAYTGGKIYDPPSGKTYNCKGAESRASSAVALQPTRRGYPIQRFRERRVS